MEYRVRAVRDEAGLEQLEDTWNDLVERSGNGSIFGSFPWNIAWWHFFGHDARPYIVVVYAAGQVCGIAPLMQRCVGLLSSLEFIGVGLSDIGDFVLDPSHAEGSIKAIFAYLHKHRRAWDLLDLDEVPPYSPVTAYLDAHKPQGLRVIGLTRNDCPYIPVPATWQEYTKTLQRKPRQHLEGFARRVVEDTGATFRVVSKECEVSDAVERFYALHRARWDTKSEELNPEHVSPEFVAFLKEACIRSAARGLLRITELWMPANDGRPATEGLPKLLAPTAIASWISFLVNGRWSGYMTGFDPAWSVKRPGKVLHGFVMREAMQEHAFEIDAGRGAEPYKYELGAVNRVSRRFTLTSNTPRSLIALGMTRGRIKAREILRRYRDAQAAKEAQAEKSAEASAAGPKQK